MRGLILMRYQGAATIAQASRVSPPFTHQPGVPGSRETALCLLSVQAAYVLTPNGPIRKIGKKARHSNPRPITTPKAKDNLLWENPSALTNKYKEAATNAASQKSCRNSRDRPNTPG